ncbi:MAG TPA: sporulation integral membrane protein YtvI [Bacillus sp. (in: firmicutes)]|uniref:sporulation integral membrane protein YtvI n=1 Tax=Bacillus litorisediminis TaxID=2922713 RepID=UPI001FAC8D95|nr:sporulation integral membrane protein YtvI [Bacillus litorisediminis]HWO77372.1 sporulation integral membrane protein YtvI [Bacillus sp. (in: firmicutes)]
MKKKYIWLGLLVAVILFLIPYSVTLVLALLTAIFLEYLVRWFTKLFRWKRFYSVLLTFILYLAFLAVASFFIVHTLFSQLVGLSEKAPALYDELYNTVILPTMSKWETFVETLPSEILTSIEAAIKNGLESLSQVFELLLENILSFAAGVPSFMIEFLVYLIALFLISLDLPNLLESVKRHLTDETYSKVSLVFGQLTQAAVGFIKAQVILSAVTFMLAYGGLWLLEVPYTALISLLIVIVDILPILGTGSALVPWAIVSIIQGNSGLGIGLIVLFLVITVVRRILEPKVLSTNLGISPLAVLVSLYIGLKLIGVAGLFLGPAVVIVYKTIKQAGFLNTSYKI